MSSPNPQHILEVPSSQSIPSKTLHSPLHYWLYHLNHHQIESRYLVVTAISSGELPSSLLHHFASDSIEQTVNFYRQTEGLIPSKALQTITVKRKWIEGQVPLSTLQQSQKELQALPQFSRSHPNLRIMQMLDWNLSVSPMIAARYATHFSTEFSERAWQHSRLITLIQNQIQSSLQLFAILYKRKELLNPQLPAWQAIYEESLFLE